MAKSAFLFPGQGAQYVGMGRDVHDALSAARVIFDRAEEVSQLPIKRLCFEGPDEELSRTDHAQPCIFTVSAALLGCMGTLLPPEKCAALRPDYMAGLSLGEYTALFAAGMLNFDDALKLVVRRGAAMQAAAQARPSGMVAIMGLDEDAAEKLCAASREGQILTPANFNCPGQIVLSGENEACQRAAEKAAEFGARGATVLNVAGAFHSEIMAPAAEKLGEALNDVAFRAPQAPNLADDPSRLAEPADAQVFAGKGVKIVSNVDARPTADPQVARSNLLAQLTDAVRWQQSMELLLAEGVTEFYEIGPGKVLTGLMKRIDRKTKVTLVNSRETLEALADTAGE
ncbi:MAG: ACP S-malonyltransferase [Phycisphaerae bacterium]|nr:ACP S-malonyltransferase [Phycisphaerae bacterium]